MSSNNFDSVLSQLNEIKQNTFVECWVPSLKKLLKFKPMSVAQQQDVIRIISSKNKGNSAKALNVINVIVAENKHDHELSDKELNVVDRDAILLQLKLNDASTSKQEAGAIKQVIDDVKQNEKLIKFTNTISKYGIEVHASIPLLHKDSTVNSKFADDLNAKDAADALTSFYNMQIIKYIDRIVVDKDVVEFNDSNSIEQYIKIIENLPADVNNAVLVYANEMQNLFSDALKQFNINLQTFPNI
jgi:hypothetical protein